MQDSPKKSVNEVAMPPRSTKNTGFLKSKQGLGGSPVSYKIDVDTDKIKYDDKGNKITSGMIPIRRQELSEVRIRNKDSSYNYYKVPRGAPLEGSDDEKNAKHSSLTGLINTNQS